MSKAEKNRIRLKALLEQGRTIIMPGAYDPITAMLIEHVGFSGRLCRQLRNCGGAIGPAGRWHSDYGRDGSTRKMCCGCCERTSVG